MKKIFLLAAILICSIAALQAQKIYTTKTGKISFYSNAPLEDIEAKNNEVESKFSPSNGQLVFMLLIKGFRFPNALMEEHFNENYMESSKYPKSVFKGMITNLKVVNFNKDGSYPVTVTGKLTIHDVTKDVEATGSIDIKEGKISATSKFNINLKDYGIGGAMVGKKIAETIAITVDCQYE